MAHWDLGYGRFLRRRIAAAPATVQNEARWNKFDRAPASRRMKCILRIGDVLGGISPGMNWEKYKPRIMKPETRKTAAAERLDPVFINRSHARASIAADSRMGVTA